jgi:hypothetical protein
MIEVIDADRDGEDWRSAVNSALADGKGAVFYEMDYRTAKVRYSALFPNAEFWYIERNGDPITLIVPKGTPREALPHEAKGYITFKGLGWEDHDA